MGADGDPDGTGDSDTVTLQVRCSNGSKVSVEAALDSTVGTLKAALVEKCDVPAEQQRLIYKGRILKDEQTLQSYGASSHPSPRNQLNVSVVGSLGVHFINYFLTISFSFHFSFVGLASNHTIHLIRALTPSAASAEAATASHGASRDPNNTIGDGRAVSSEDGQFGGTDSGGMLFRGIGVNRRDGTGSGSLGFGLPELNQMQQQLAQNPSMMREIMNMPAVQSLINNPDLIRGMIMNNPQMREIIDRNPEFAHILNDPSTLRQSLEVMRNPELMRELMRNTDRAMSNIESSPEGFNMLRRMYETVQEPFLNATTAAGEMGNDLGQNPFVALLGNQGSTQAGNQRPGQSGTGSDVATESAAPNSNPLPNPWSSTGKLFCILHMVLSPQLRGLLGSNSQLSDMLQNPELIRQLTSPETMQFLLPVCSNFYLFNNHFYPRLFGSSQDSKEQNQTSDGTAVPPEERYATQLTQLREMGFFDTQENIRALSATAGNIHAAVEWLLRNL
ncbi:hypothetical protein BHE74_00051897 [Ensete ventricosum]|nr:hypothetical protein BHE74_00051897 [Ensete ventricosum]